MQQEFDERTQLARERTVLASERNKLANDRTFLAWIRTGLGSVGGGVAVMKLLTFYQPLHKTLAEIMGSTLIVLGITIFILSYFDYRKSYRLLKQESKYPGTMVSITLISVVLVVVSFVLLIIARPSH